MDNRIIHIISNIKVIGWLCILTFSGILYYCLHSLISIYLMNQLTSQMLTGEPNLNSLNKASMNGLIIQAAFWLIFSGLVSIAGILIGYSLLQMRKWAAIAFHILSISIGLLILGGVIYLVAQSYQTPSGQFFTMNQSIIRYKAASIGTFGLLITWLITKANLLLFRKDYKVNLC